MYTFNRSEVETKNNKVKCYVMLCCLLTDVPDKIQNTHVKDKYIAFS